MTHPTLSEEILEIAVNELMAEKSRAPLPHPSPAELWAFSAGELDEHEADYIREHLVICIPCSHRVLAFEPESETAESQGSKPGFPGRFTSAALIAATLVAGILGAYGGHWWQLASVTNPALLTLEPTTRTSHSPSSGPADQPLVLVVELEVAGPRELYELEVLSQETGEQRLRSQVASNEKGQIALALPPHFLEPGSYRMVLRRRAGETPPEIFKFEISPPNRP